MKGVNTANGDRKEASKTDRISPNSIQSQSHNLRHSSALRPQNRQLSPTNTASSHSPLSAFSSTDRITPPTVNPTAASSSVFHYHLPSTLGGASGVSGGVGGDGSPTMSMQRSLFPTSSPGGGAGGVCSGGAFSYSSGAISGFGHTDLSCALVDDYNISAMRGISGGGDIVGSSGRPPTPPLGLSHKVGTTTNSSNAGSVMNRKTPVPSPRWRQRQILDQESLERQQRSADDSENFPLHSNSHNRRSAGVNSPSNNTFIGPYGRGTLSDILPHGFRNAQMSRQRVLQLATTPTGFAYIPSPLSRRSNGASHMSNHFIGSREGGNSISGSLGNRQKGSSYVVKTHLTRGASKSEVGNNDGRISSTSDATIAATGRSSYTPEESMQQLRKAFWAAGGKESSMDKFLASNLKKSQQQQQSYQSPLYQGSAGRIHSSVSSPSRDAGFPSFNKSTGGSNNKSDRVLFPITSPGRVGIDRMSMGSSIRKNAPALSTSRGGADINDNNGILTSTMSSAPLQSQSFVSHCSKNANKLSCHQLHHHYPQPQLQAKTWEQQEQQRLLELSLSTPTNVEVQPNIANKSEIGGLSLSNSSGNDFSGVSSSSFESTGGSDGNRNSYNKHHRFHDDKKDFHNDDVSKLLSDDTTSPIGTTIPPPPATPLRAAAAALASAIGSATTPKEISSISGYGKGAAALLCSPPHKISSALSEMSLPHFGGSSLSSSAGSVGARFVMSPSKLLSTPLRLRSPWSSAAAPETSEETGQNAVFSSRSTPTRQNFNSTAVNSSNISTPPISPSRRKTPSTTANILSRSTFRWTPLRSVSNVTTSEEPQLTMSSTRHMTVPDLTPCDTSWSVGLPAQPLELPPHSHKLYPNSRIKFSPTPLVTWENCLYVRAEGGISGTLRLTPTHLIFIYDDWDYFFDNFDDTSNKNKKNNNNKPVFERDNTLDQADSNGHVSPVNASSDGLGEGSGVEVIGTDTELEQETSSMYESGFGDESDQEEEVAAEGHCAAGDASVATTSKMSILKSFSFDEVKSEIMGDNAVENTPRSKTIAIHEEQELVNGSESDCDGRTRDEPEELRLMRIRRERKMDPKWSEQSTPVSSSSSVFSANSSEDGSLHDGEDDGDYFVEEPYEEMMNKSIIRAIEEEARRRLQELEDEEEAAAAASTINNVAPCNTWERERLRAIERRAERYMKRLDESGDMDYDESFEDDMSYLGGNKSLSKELACTSDEVMAQIQDEEEERMLYTTGMDKAQERKYRGIKWPLSKLAEAYPRRYMMREVAFEIYGPSPAPSFTSSLRRMSSTSSSGGTLGEETDVPLGPLSKLSVYLAIPDVNAEDDNKKGRVRFGRRKKNKPRRDLVIETLKEHAPQMNLVHWQALAQAHALWQWGGIGVSFEGNEEKQLIQKRRTWSPALLFRRRGDRSDPLYLLTRAWRKGSISNYDYLLRLNAIAGRSFHDPGSYPVMPWVLSNYTSTNVPDLSDERNFRDLSKPMGALCPERLHRFMDKYMSICGSMDSAIPAFMYGSHYSNTGGVALHFLVRVRPFAGLHRQLQGGQFDVPDRLFKSVPQTWEMCSKTSATEVKELTPEWYSDPSFLKNVHNFNLGTSVAGTELGDVILPPWADNNPSKFIEVMRNALESDLCSVTLPAWIDLIFGFKQKGPEARKAYNVFYHLTYYDPDDLAKITDEGLRTETELHIADFGHCPLQLFPRSHPHKQMDKFVTHSKGELRFITSLKPDMSVSSPRRIRAKSLSAHSKNE